MSTTDLYIAFSLYINYRISFSDAIELKQSFISNNFFFNIYQIYDLGTVDHGQFK